MADLNVETIIKQLNKRFDENIYRIFWYDDRKEFTDSIGEIADNLHAKFIKLQPNEQFKTKLQLEDDSQSKYLIYADFVRPKTENNFLADIEHYSSMFTADASELILQEIGMPKDKLMFIRKYRKFFGNKDRTARFKKIYLFNKSIDPVLIILAVLTKSIQPKITAVLSAVFQKNVANNPFLAEFEKYNVKNAFWSCISEEFGYSLHDKSNLNDLISSLILNYAYYQMGVNLPVDLENYSLRKANNVISYVKSLSDSNSQQKFYDQVTNEVWENLDIEKFFKRLSIEAIIKCDVFAGNEKLILNWIKERIIAKDFKALVGKQTLEEITKNRQIKANYHFAQNNTINGQYYFLEYAIKLLTFPSARFNSVSEIAENYTSKLYLFDTYYRNFVTEYSNNRGANAYREIKDQVENSYLSKLNQLVTDWNQGFSLAEVPLKLQQRRFYSNYLVDQNDRIVVIISDAFRFELAKNLQKDLESDDRITTQMSYMITGLPSVTYMGMPALLPHHQMELAADKKVDLDGQAVDTREKRAKLLAQYNANSAVYSLDDLKRGKVGSTELKQKFAGKKLVYIYHNEVDAVGDNPKTENEVFSASQVAIDEIKDLIARLRTISVTNIFVTADHGYIYREKSIPKEDKIDLKVIDPTKRQPRYLITSEKIVEPGVLFQSLGTSLGNDDPRLVVYPLTANVFTSVGAKNYVHGGSSPEEMIVPLLRIKTISRKSAAKSVDLNWQPTNARITSLENVQSFVQSSPISDMFNAADFKIYFIDEKGESISSIETIHADSHEKDVKDRIYQVQLHLKNQKYDKSKIYKLVIENLKTKIKHTVDFQMDITIADDFGFDF
ncbi:MAG: BREX-1 system phosphatase PglZ type A [Liquorilactobacillus ghanensis]|uniref:BREX-1 system phosphatase PglZ type A n=1 Tax=Liquorilactobacillus ghanensis TaxID=399370 RepID=UPI0039EC1494